MDSTVANFGARFLSADRDLANEWLLTENGLWQCMQVGAAHAASQEAYSLIRKGTEAYRSMSQIHSMPVARTFRSIIVELCLL